MATLVLLSAALAVAYARDAYVHRGRVASGVRVGGILVSRRSPAALSPVLAQIERRYTVGQVVVRLPAGSSFASDGASMGLHVDSRATRDRVLRAGRGGSLPGRMWGWLVVTAVGRHREVPLAFTVDESPLTRVAAIQTGMPNAAPVEPSIAVGPNGTLVGRAGRPGAGIDIHQLALDLPAAARRGTPVRVMAHDAAVSPRLRLDEAAALAHRAEMLVTEPLALESGGVDASLSPATLRTLMVAVPAGPHLELQVNERAAAQAASHALAAAGTPGHDATFTVNADGTVSIGPSAVGTGCCGAEAGHRVGLALLGPRPDGPVRLPLASQPPRITEQTARGLGIKEQIGTFTTRYVAGQPRVGNIHHIADLVRGQVILPDETFSVNDFIGPRTTEGGFVVDHVIEDGVFSEAVGGGISQFATTLFNAAWFGGLDFGEYQSHSIYISRYPYGRDATLNFTHPDLQIQNTTPYGVLIWPTYTNSSLTVTLYSTRFVTATTAGQDKTPLGSCTRVTSHRLRAYTDGRTAMDETFATYQAAEGQPCGASTPTPTIACPIAQRPCPLAPVTTPPPASGAVPTATTKKPLPPPSAVPPATAAATMPRSTSVKRAATG